MAIKDYPAHIPTAQFMAGVRSMGIDPTEVRSLYMAEGEVQLDVYDLDDQGRRRINDDQDDAITQTVVIPLS
jgi:hypothetical protein